MACVWYIIYGMCVIHNYYQQLLLVRKAGITLTWHGVHRTRNGRYLPHLAVSVRQQDLYVNNVICRIWCVWWLRFDGELELGRGPNPGRSHIELTVAEDRLAQPYSDELESLSLGLVDCDGEWSCDGELAPAPLEGELSIFGSESDPRYQHLFGSARDGAP